MQKLIVFSVVAFLAILFAACGVPKPFQHALYLQDSVTSAEKVVTNSTVLIQPGDRLSINVTAINKDAANEFNTNSASTGNAAIQGYLVDSTGNIQMLQLGNIKVGGLTTTQTASYIKSQLDSFIKGSIVTVSISNFKVSVFGEVGHPGVIMVPDGNLTILDALVQSGDLSLYGKRDNILVVREMNGKREFGRVDVNSNQVFLSPYYYLKQNDMVYVEADKTKFISSDPKMERALRNLGIATTILSLVVLIINLNK